MFGSKTKTDQSTKSTTMTNVSNSINSLVQGTRVEGKVSADNDIRIDGEIIGNLTCKAKVIIGPTGKIEGDVSCQNALIEGVFEGSLRVEETLNVRETSRISGDISTNKLIVQSGAIFNVECTMGKKKESEIPKKNNLKIGAEVAK